jgi:hypothetical protein
LADVSTLFKRRGWLVQNDEDNVDFLKHNFSTQNDVLVASSYSSLLGKLGDYGPMTLLALWEFDNNNRLVDILVWRKLRRSECLGV